MREAGHASSVLGYGAAALALVVTVAVAIYARVRTRRLRTAPLPSPLAPSRAVPLLGGSVVVLALLSGVALVV